MKPNKQYSPQKAKRNSLQITPKIIQKPLSVVRNDIRAWRSAQTMALHPENPKMFPLYNLYKDILLDARLFSQIENRKQKSIGAFFNILKADGKIHEQVTETLQKSLWFDQIIGHILDTRFFGHTLIELDIDSQGTPIVSLVPRQNVLPAQGVVLKDYTDEKGIDYRNAKELGVWLLEFGTPRELGLLDKVVPHVVFKRFAQSCWSELCEIFGIPPRVMKTNTQDTIALNRAEQMMKDMAAAAWFIIDETESFEFASSTVPPTGEVYNGLIRLCNEEIALLISGAIIGQDTKFGTQGKEQVSQGLLLDLVAADQTMVELYMNDKVLPALYLCGILPEMGLRFEYDKSDDISELWTRTKEILPYKDVDNQWIKDKFGIEVMDKPRPQQEKFAFPTEGFFD